MRVVYDYGARPISMPKGGPATRAATDSSANAAASRRTPVVIIHVGEGARRMQDAALTEGARAAEQTREAGASVTPGPAAGGRGIPIPGTDFVLTAGEDAARVDRGVRAHERAHQIALGPYAESGVMLTTRRGPDGRSYAVGGRIGADLSPVPGNPQATIRKANAVRRAALTPGSPSAADMRVAAEAYRLARAAKEDLAAERTNIRSTDLRA